MALTDRHGLGIGKGGLHFTGQAIDTHEENLLEQINGINFKMGENQEGFKGSRQKNDQIF
jgi:hypothetical protein